MVKISSINLWCKKNLVDLQYLLGWIFSKSKAIYTYDINEADLVFINTCWFLWSSRDELIHLLEEIKYVKWKIYLFWCAVKYFSQNWFIDIKKYLETKKVFILSWQDLDLPLEVYLKWYNSQEFKDYDFFWDVIMYTNYFYWYEYVKIAEWCNWTCTFCIIPKLRWKQKSKSIEKILEEIKNLVNFWVKEIILISQDSSMYWIDIYWKPYLINLLKEIEKLEWDFKYRILYMYPDILNIKDFIWLKKFIPYFDMPIQHASNKILKLMWRHYTIEKIEKLIIEIRNTFKESFIRTNFIVWFPWEDENDFNILKNFIEKDYFDNISLFEYHDEPLASSYKLKWKNDENIIRKRFNILKNLVNRLIDNRRFSNWKHFKWIIMDIWKKVKIRPYLSAPEIDPFHEVDKKNIKWEIKIWNLVDYFIK